MIGYFRMDVTEGLLNTKVMFFLEFLWLAPNFYTKSLNPQHYKIKMAHPTFRVMRQSCSAYSLSSKYRSSLNPYAVLFITFILLLIPSTLPVDIWQSYHARIPVRCAIIVAAIFISCGTLLSLACLTQSSNTLSASFLFTCVPISLSCSFR